MPNPSLHGRAAAGRPLTNRGRLRTTNATAHNSGCGHPRKASHAAPGFRYSRGE
ncbi:hypothetical protein ACFPM0_00680 [Pseudonocardia sulfidoxydans]|uniref:hypothetical protein n=1 Tax=Pseudonocardia sulfidoxydans TaxID=54011 RepID=UPI0036069C38